MHDHSVHLCLHLMYCLFSTLDAVCRQ